MTSVPADRRRYPIRRTISRLASACLLLGALTWIGSPASAADWHQGWCERGEGLSVVVDFGDSPDPDVPVEGFLVRCLIGGALDNPGGNARIVTFEAVGLEVTAQNGLVTSIAGVAQDPAKAKYWMFAGAEDGTWDPSKYALNGTDFTDWSYGARWGGSVPRLDPPFGSVEQLQAARPTITGTARIGKKLRANTPGWTTGTTFRFQWFAGNKAIGEATARRYQIRAADRGKRLKVQVTGSKPGFTTEQRMSKATVKVGR